MAEKAARKTSSGGKQALIMKRSGSQRVESASRKSASRLPTSRLIDARIQELADWRGEMLSRLRALIRQADPQVVEECKWKKPSNPAGTPVKSNMATSRM